MKLPHSISVFCAHLHKTKSDPSTVRAAALIDADHFKTAKTHAVHAIQSNPSNHLAHYLCAISNKHSEDAIDNYQQALDHVSTAIRIQPQNSHYYKLRAEIYLKLGQTRKASDDMGHAFFYLHKTPHTKTELAGFYTIQGMLYSLNKMKDYAAVYYNQAVFLDDLQLHHIPVFAIDPEHSFLRGHMSMLCGRPDRAIIDYSIAIHFAPKKTDYRHFQQLAFKERERLHFPLSMIEMMNDDSSADSEIKMDAQERTPVPQTPYKLKVDRKLNRSHFLHPRLNPTSSVKRSLLSEFNACSLKPSL